MRLKFTSGRSALKSLAFGVDTAAELFDTVKECLQDELKYLSVQLYAPRSAANIEAAAALRNRLAERFNRAVSVSFGPRYLHSTGQLHKGGPDNGVFLHILAENNDSDSCGAEGEYYSRLIGAQLLGDSTVLGKKGQTVAMLKTHDLNAALERLSATQA